jgi:hypothetical protein
MIGSSCGGKVVIYDDNKMIADQAKINISKGNADLFRMNILTVIRDLADREDFAPYNIIHLGETDYGNNYDY